MVKAKRRQLATLATNKDDTLRGLVESSICRAEGDLLEDDDWVIVKKQRITILIPPLPSVQRLQPSTPQGPRTNKRQPKSKKIKRRQPQIPNERHLRKHSSDDELQKSDALMTSKGDTQINGKTLASPPNPKKLAKPASRRSTPIDPSNLIGKDSTYIRTSIKYVHDKRILGGGSGSVRAVEVSGVRKPLNKNIRLTATTSNFCPTAICQSQGPSRLFVRPSACCLNVGVGAFQQNQKMRASNLERKLEKAGGLSRWLMSLGLGQFVQMFHTRNVNDKFQLLNLTMGKLKDMGAIAVGPRRKLMHAIDCLLFQQGCTLRSRVLESRVLRDQIYGWDAAS